MTSAALGPIAANACGLVAARYAPTDTPDLVLGERCSSGLPRGTGLVDLVIARRRSPRGVSVVYPRFGHHQVDAKAQPEGSTESLFERQAGSREKTDEQLYGRHSRGQGKGSDHPFAMQVHPLVADVPHRLAEREEKEGAEDGHREEYEAPSQTDYSTAPLGLSALSETINQISTRAGGGSIGPL